MGIDSSKSAVRMQSVINKKRAQFRRLVCEGLEQRLLLAADGPRLLSVAPNASELLSVTRENVLHESPRELVLRFDSDVSQASLASGIQIFRSGGDGAFGADVNGNNPIADVRVLPAFLDFGESNRIVIARFSQPLVDDFYSVQVLGVGSPSPVSNAAGQNLLPRIAGTDRDTYTFDLELGTKIIAVVPQPVVRQGDGSLSRLGDTVEVYFNDPELYNQPVTTGPGVNPTVVDPQFYNLILTQDTVSPNDDQVFRPTSISYDPVLMKATLTFASNLEALSPTLPGAGTFRLRVGSSEAIANITTPVAPQRWAPGTDPGSVLNQAVNIDNSVGTLNGSFSTVITEQIVTNASTTGNPTLLLDYPGSIHDPGHRDIQDEVHVEGRDGSPGITVRFYSFMDNQPYGTDVLGRPLFTSITQEQRTRVREVFEFYSMQMGIDFVERVGTVGGGDIQVVVGDMAPLGIVSGPGDVAGVAGGNLAIMDGAENWDNSFGYGSNIAGSFFTVAMHEIGHLLGLGHTYELPPGAIMGDQAMLGRAGNPLEQIFPSAADVVHGQHLYRPDNRDADLYRFEIPASQAGEVRIETFAERLNNSSNLDTYLTLLKREADGSLSIVSANNNYFSDDSFIRADLGPGEYFISVTGKGNEDHSPLVNNSGSGAVSAGTYQLRFDFKSTTVGHLSEQRAGSTALGTEFDGDGDGIAGGDFNFWFRAAAPYSGATLPGDNNGVGRTLYVDKVYVGSNPVGSLARPFRNISDAIAVARPGDVVRVMGDNRTPGNLTDDRAYEIGTGGAAIGTLPDGATLDVPNGVTLVIDAGAILKFGGAGILVGSNDSTTDRSNASIQVLGIPGRPVYMTSYFDQSLGIDTNPLNTTPTAGDWGGIEIRNDFDRAQGRFDREREGVFLNTISNADIRYGGGQIGVGARARVVSPINLSEARPLILNNTITRSGDAAISADPNSFEETLFTESRYQQVGAFVPNYQRVGPDIRSNTISNNTINGLFVKIETLAGGGLQTLSVPGRIDDSEITIVLGENLLIEGTPGGSAIEAIGPNVSLVTRTPSPTVLGDPAGFAGATTAEYVVTYVDRFGQESLPSAPMTVTVANGQKVTLGNLPVATLDYVSRKLYRNDNGETSGGTKVYKLVANLNRDNSQYVDFGRSIAGTLQTQGLTSVQRARRDASLVVDPGTVIKSLGGRIEIGVGATMIAEGTKSKPIVFTSRLDDRYGAGGTFDTNNDGSSVGAPGDWAGIVSRHLGELSLDHTIVTFGGGNSRVPGGFASFNAIEIHQSTARIANSLIEYNASGTGTRGNTNRDGRGVNDEAAIFVLASQPVILNNVIRHNSEGTGSATAGTAAISIDANSLNYKSIRDHGRSTGLNEREPIGIGNFGPLVSNNRLGGNAINGMMVRGATLMTESVWDDTDIVHVLTSEIVVPDFHTYGGLRLMSSAGESLVVKLSGAQAGFTAGGRPLDITDRIGGSLQILGSPGFPVVLTSLADDTIGAGFDYAGRSMLDTNNNGNATTPQPGSWRSVRFDPFSNDRNVDQLYEQEPDLLSNVGFNDLPNTAEYIGALAPNLSSGDENLRLGFTVTGSVAAPSDLDVYRISGVAGTTVWLDIDQTSGNLDSVLELIDGDGRIIALSDNSLNESLLGSTYYNPALIPDGRVLPMDQDPHALHNASAPVDLDTLGINPLDAGFRVVLPGSAGSVNNYYIRVRSSNLSSVPTASGVDRSNPNRLTDPALVNQGITVGQYKLQIRLQQTQEVAGSTVRFADIRYATNGIEALGTPYHSPLIGDFAETNPNETSNAFVSQALGNLLSSDRGSLSVAGQFVGADFVDFYSINVSRDSIQQVSTTPAAHASVIFDIDYADGLGRANTQLWIFDSTGRLILTGDDSNIIDDQPGANRGSDTSDLTRGSLGNRDAYIGPIELPLGTYYVGVSNKSQSHVTMRQFSDADGGGFANIRVEPIDSVRRISEDRFDPAYARPTNAVAPIQVSFDASSPTSSMFVPYNLSDVTLFSTTGRNIQFVNPLTGVQEAIYSTNGTQAVNFGVNSALLGLAVTPGGQGIAYQRPASGNITDGNQGAFVALDLGNGTVAAGTSGLITTTTRQTPNSNPATYEVISVPNAGGNNGVGTTFTALTFAQIANVDLGGGALAASLWGVAQRNGGGNQPIIGIVNNTPTAVGIGAPVVSQNILYRLSSYNTGTMGTALDPTNLPTLNAAQRGMGAGTGVQAHGFFVKPDGLVTTLGSAGGANFRILASGSGADQDVTLQFINAGNPNATPPNAPTISVDVPTRAITIDLNGGGATLQQIRALLLSPPASTLVSVSTITGDPTERVGYTGNTTLPIPASRNYTDSNGNIRTNPADGQVTGLASIGTRLYAVTNAGELMGINPATNQRHVYSNSYLVLNDPQTGQPIQFNALTTGPRNVADLPGVDYSQILFGVSTTGRMYAFNANGEFQNIFTRGLPYVDSASFSGTTGIQFSSLDSNLWHSSLFNEAEAGHGRPATFNRSNDGQTTRNFSLRFGYADPTANLGAQPGNYNGIYRVPDLYNTVSAPGGARGAIESAVLDLTEYSANDQPYLYFNYRLETQNSNTAIGSNQAALDTFRVYAMQEDGSWILLGTNNSPEMNSSASGQRIDFGAAQRQSGSDEFDWRNTGLNGTVNQDFFGLPRMTTEFFDNAGWRQARISLASLAGMKNVKLRFEYATGGDFRTITTGLQADSTRNGLEFTAVPGELFNDSNGLPAQVQGFNVTALTPTGATTTRAFEFDLGLVLSVPGAPSFKAGDEIRIGTDVFTFSATAGPTNILLSPGPQAQAQSIADTLRNNGYDVAISSLVGSIINVYAKDGVFLTDATPISIVGADPNIIIGRPGTVAGAAPVFVHNAMTAAEVRDAVRQALARELNAVGQESNTNVYRVRDNTILIHGAQAQLTGIAGAGSGLRVTAIANNSPMQSSGGRVGDMFGPMNASNPLFSASFATQSNRVQGLQIDDIIIGFAERGETVFNAPTGNQSFSGTPFYSPIYSTGGLRAWEIETGTYQLEARVGADYGTTPESGELVLAGGGRTFETNDRLSKSLALHFNPNYGSGLLWDGDYFTLSDGVNIATFEFDIVNSPADPTAGVASGNIPVSITPASTPAEIVRAIRDAINGPTAQAILKLTASTGGDMRLGTLETDPRSLRIDLHGPAAADLVGGLSGFASGFVPLTATRYGQETGFGEDLGDANSVRDQGQFIVSSTTVRNSQNYGINLDAASQTQPVWSGLTGTRPYPGAARNMVTLNISNVVPGAVLMNNVVYANGVGGINISGDTANTNGAPPKPIARVVNNTIYGNGSGTGINVGEGASPYLLNNIVANFATGISVAADSVSGTIVGGTLYQRNGANLTGGGTQSFSIVLADTAPLFNDPANGKFYLASLSQAIDSSISSLENRASIEQVKAGVGLPTSSILAPTLDINGLRRSDDPLVNTPAGMGQNVFLDRGAIDRVDFSGPEAILMRPLDNDSLGNDRDASPTNLYLSQGTYDFFEILLDESSGTGVDSQTVNDQSVIITENGRRLIPGSDYEFGYSANSRTVRLTPLGGFWRTDSIYEITIVNQLSYRLDVPAASAVTDGAQIRFQVAGEEYVLEFDSNNAVSSGAIAVPFESTMTRAHLAGQINRVLRSQTLTGAGLKSFTLAGDTLLLSGATNLTSGIGSVSIAPVRDMAGNNLQANRSNSLTQFTIVMNEVRFDFGDAMERSGTGSHSSTLATNNGSKHAIFPIDEPLLVLGQYVDFDENGQPSNGADGDDNDSMVTYSAAMPFSIGEVGPARLIVAAKNPAMIGRSITISDHVNPPVVFRFTDGPTSLPAEEVAVDIQSATTADEVAEALRTAIDLHAIQTGRVFNLMARRSGNILTLGGDDTNRFQLADMQALGFIQRDQTGSLTIVMAKQNSAGTLMDGQILTIADGSGREVNFQVIDTSVGVPSSTIGSNIGVRIALPSATDASIATAFRDAINAAIGAGRLHLPMVTQSGNELRILADDEDGVQFQGVFNPASPPVTVTITASNAGYIDAWVDWNQDNDFDDEGEKMINSIFVVPGENTFTFATPAGAVVGYTTARFRLSSTGGLTPAGLAIGGEVEDHVIEIVAGDPPQTVNDPSTPAGQYRVLEDGVLVVDRANGILANDINSGEMWVYDFDPSTPTMEPVVAPMHGTLEFIPEASGPDAGEYKGAFRYVPNRNFTGIDTFVYLARSARLISSTPATVTINVLPVNDAPVGVDDSITILEDNGDQVAAPTTNVTWSGDLFTANDIRGRDPDGTVATNEASQNLRVIGASIVSTRYPGDAVSVDPVANTITFTPGTHFNHLIGGQVIVELTIEDDGVSGLIGPSDSNNPTATINPDPKTTTSRLTITINPLNDRPVFTLTQTMLNESESVAPALQSYPIVEGVHAAPPLATDENSGATPQTVTGFQVAILANHPNPNSLFTQVPRIVGTGASRRLEYQLAPNVNWITAGGDAFNTGGTGNIVLELTAIDDGAEDSNGNVNRSLVQRVTIQISPVNDPPSFDISMTNLTINEDAPLQIIPGFYSNELAGPPTAADELPPSPSAQTVTRTVTVPAGAEILYAVLPRLAGNGDLEFQLKTDVNSNFAALFGNPDLFNIVVTATDDGTEGGVFMPKSTSKTLSLFVTPVNDAPTFTAGETRVDVVEDAGAVSIPNFVSNVRASFDPSAIDEASQVLHFEMSYSNPSLFAVPPAIDASGRLTFQPAPDQSGTSIVIARLFDNGAASPAPNNNAGPTHTFTIAISPINDAPEFDIPTTLTVTEDAGVVSISNFATNVRPGPETASDESRQTLTFTLVHYDPNLFEVPPVLQTDGTLSFKTRLDVNSNTAGIDPIVRFQLIDGGPDSPAPNTNKSIIKEFTLLLTPVNDPPVPNLHVVNIEEDHSVTINAADVLVGDEPGPLDERLIDGQTVRMTQIEFTSVRGGNVVPVIVGGVVQSFTYTPPANLVGDDFIRYVATDNGNPEMSGTGTIRISIAPVNDAPQFSAGPHLTVLEDSTPYNQAWATNILAGPVNAPDEWSEPGAQNVSFVLTPSNPAFFSVQPAINASGVLTFTLARDVNGSVTVDIIAEDDGPRGGENVYRSSSHRLTISVTSLNDPPGFILGADIVLNEDSGAYSAPFVTSIVGAEGMNSTPPTGSDEAGNSVTFAVTNSNPALFAAQPTIDVTGRLSFTPAQNAFGTVEVYVVASDNGPSTPPNVNTSAPKTFRITFTPQNDAPIAVNDRYDANEDDVLVVNAPGVLANDIDVDLPADNITVVVPTDPIISRLGAIVTINADGSFSYDPRTAQRIQRLTQGEIIADAFNYTIRDAAGLISNLGTVSLTVTGINDSPIAFDDSFRITAGIATSLSVLENDFDVDSGIDVRTVEVGRLPTHGTVTVLASGRIEYLPNAGYVGEDSFTYRFRDSHGAVSNEATVSVSSSQQPVAVDDIFTISRGRESILNVLRNDYTPGQTGGINPSSVTIADGPDVGTAVVLPSGDIRYTPPTNFTGVASFKYYVSDLAGLPSNVATVTIRVQASQHQNPSNRYDVSGDGFVSPIDVLLIVNDINFRGSRPLPDDMETPPYLDVNGNGAVDPLDVLEVINYINARGSAGAGEGEGLASVATFPAAAPSVAEAADWAPINVEVMPSERYQELVREKLQEIEAELTELLLQEAEELTTGGYATPMDFGSDKPDEEETFLAHLANHPQEDSDPVDDLFADESFEL